MSDPPRPHDAGGGSPAGRGPVHPSSTIHQAVTAPRASAGPSDADAAARARAEAAAGEALFHRGDFNGALARYRQAVWLQPANRDYHFSLGLTAWRAVQLDLIERHFLEAVRLDPQFAAGHEALGQWYYQSAELPKALHHSARAMVLAPDNPEIVISRAVVLGAGGQAHEAWQLIEPLVPPEGGPPPPVRLATTYAELAPKLGGDHDRRAVALVRRALTAPTLPRDRRAALHFAASAMLDRTGRYDDAFAQAKLGNDLARRPWDRNGYAGWISHRIRYATPERLRAFPRATHGNRRPVLIVGMPRSGTSLVEQILASHPQVFGAGELPTLGKVPYDVATADWSEGDPYPECLESLSVKKANRLAGQYLSVIESLDRDATYVTDKMPLNFQWLGLAELLLPGCHVIHCVRNPLDTCLSCYLTDFATANEFTYDLADLGAYYRDYRRLIDHWKQVLTLPILDVRYEDLVLDPEAHVRRMLDFLGLPWDDRCMRFHENQRAVKTASKDQVRRPMYTSSVGRWKHYEQHLGPLMSAMAAPPPPAP